MQITLEAQNEFKIKVQREKRRKPRTEPCHSRSRRGRLRDTPSIHTQTRRVCQGEGRVSRRRKWLTASDSQESKVHSD